MVEFHFTLDAFYTKRIGKEVEHVGEGGGRFGCGPFAPQKGRWIYCKDMGSEAVFLGLNLT